MLLSALVKAEINIVSRVAIPLRRTAQKDVIFSQIYL